MGRSPPWPPRRRKVDIDGLLALAASAPALDAAAPALPPPVEGRPHRRGPGQGVLLLLRRRPESGDAGGRAGGVLPLADESLPEGACGLYLGAAIRSCSPGPWRPTPPCGRRCAPPWRGSPTVAECGGFLYLNRSALRRRGAGLAHGGALPGRAANTGKLGRFGYVTLTAKKGRPAGPGGDAPARPRVPLLGQRRAGERLPGDKPQSSRGGTAFHTPDAVRRLSHFHFWAAPSAARTLAAAARRYVQEASLGHWIR